MEILNSYVTQDLAWWHVLLLFSFINVASVGIALLFDEEWYVGLIIGIVLCCMIFGIMVAAGAFEWYTVYEARIDDTVSFNDIYGHYKIISQRGNIYILKELIK